MKQVFIDIVDAPEVAFWIVELESATVTVRVGNMHNTKRGEKMSSLNGFACS